MDQFTREDLTRLVKTADTPVISIYMPTHRAGRDVQENATRFKNLMKTAMEQLQGRFPQEKSVMAQLNKAAQLENDGEWWQHQSDGLAMYISGDRFDRYRVPLRFEERVTVGPRALVRPIVRLLQGDGQFYILATSQNRVRLLEGTHYSVDELDSSQLPSDLRSALNIDEYTSSLQQHSAGGSEGAGTMMFHGQGAADMDVAKKDEIRQFFHRIDAALDTYFSNERTPLVFAGVEYLFPLFREACHYNGLVDRSVTGNPDDLSPEELHRKAWSVVEPQFAKQQEAAVDRFHDVAGGPKAVTALAELIRAAQQGAVDTLLLAEDKQEWGIVDQQTGQVTTTDENAEGAEELLNCAAVHTLGNSGTVYCLPHKQMPNQQHAAAVLRFPLPSA